MSQSVSVHGGRGRLIINGKLRGVFSSVQWSINYDAQPIYTLGKMSAQEIVYTAQEAISCSATGFRIVDNGAYNAADLPRLQDLLNAEDMELSIEDRKTGKRICTILGVRPTGYSTGITARGVMELSVNFLGLVSSDETDKSPQNDAGSTNLLDGI